MKDIELPNDVPVFIVHTSGKIRKLIESGLYRKAGPLSVSGGEMFICEGKPTSAFPFFVNNNTFYILEKHLAPVEFKVEGRLLSIGNNFPN